MSRGQPVRTAHPTYVAMHTVVSRVGCAARTKSHSTFVAHTALEPTP